MTSTAWVTPLFAEEPPSISVGSEAQERVLVTVYNSGRGLVTDRRKARLPVGTLQLNFGDVAQKIMPETVAITSPSAPTGLSVIEQNYEYDLLSPQKLLEKYVGKKILLSFVKLQNNSEVVEQKEALLLSTNNGTVWKIDNGIVINPAYKGISFPEIPGNLRSKPTLVWLLDNKTSEAQTIETSYLTNGMSWKADYVFTLESDEKVGDLVGWVTVKNESGAAYSNARLQLIAGDVNQVQDAQEYPESDMRVMTMGAAQAKRGFEEKSFFEYHLYTLQHPTTLSENQQKQVNLLEGKGSAIEKMYRVSGQSWFYRQSGSGNQKQKVEVIVRLKNAESNKLGIPLPKGIVRVYQKDTDGSTQFIGEDSIDHTPKNENVDLKLGDAFDIVAERKQTDWKALGSTTFESAHQVTLRNHKETDVVVKVIEPVGGDWEMVKNTHPFVKTSAFSAEFDVPVKAGGEAQLEYRVRSRY